MIGRRGTDEDAQRCEDIDADVRARVVALVRRVQGRGQGRPVRVHEAQRVLLDDERTGSCSFVDHRDTTVSAILGRRADGGEHGDRLIATPSSREVLGGVEPVVPVRKPTSRRAASAHR